MSFQIEGKVAIITGGASGIGYRKAEELLKHGLKGVTLADFDEEKGREAEENLNKTYGNGKALFVKTDVTDKNQFEDAFKKTIEKFKYVDILINNAGIMNDNTWEREIDINVKGPVNGIILGLENYLQKHRQGDTSLIVNVASVVGTTKGYGYMPVYAGTKAAVIAMTLGWGTPHHFNRTKVRMVAICPGSTKTSLIDMQGHFLTPDYEAAVLEATDLHNIQEVDNVAKELIKIIQFASNSTVWVIENNEPAYEYKLANRHDFTKTQL